MNLRWIASYAALGTACSTAPDFGDGRATSSSGSTTAGDSTTDSASSGSTGAGGAGGEGGSPGVSAVQASSAGGAGTAGTAGGGGGGPGGGGDGGGGTGPCGNGVLDDGETCDDGSASCVDCTFTCPTGFVPAATYPACYGTIDGEALGTSFFEAASACAALSIGDQRARLPTPRSAGDIAALARLERPDLVWLGATDLHEEGARTWIDEPSVAFGLEDSTVWAVGEPNDAGGEDCVRLGRDAGEVLFEGRCGDRLEGRIVCEVVAGWALDERCGDRERDPGEECEAGSPLLGRACNACNLEYEGLGSFYESPLDHAFFGVFNANASKAEAATTCETLGARLATPDDPGDISVLRDVSGGGAGWLGATPSMGIAGYTWDSGETFDFPIGSYPWAVGEPSSVNLPLVMLGGELFDVDPSSFATSCEIGDESL